MRPVRRLQQARVISFLVGTSFTALVVLGLCMLRDRDACPMIEDARLLHPPDDLSRGGDTGEAWFHRNWEPHISCAHERRVGSFGDGGKWVCSPECMLRRCGCRVVSIGESSFAGALTSEYGCRVHAFGHEGSVSAGVSLKDLFAGAGFKRVDVLSVNVGSGELTAFLDKDNLEFMQEAAAQLLVTVHWSPHTTEALARQLTEAGFYVFHKEPNMERNGSVVVDYSLLNRRRYVWWSGCLT